VTQLLRRLPLPPKIESGLQRRGVEAVRILLTTSGGPGDGAVVQGLFDFDHQMPISRGDAEWWVQQHDEAEAHRAAMRFWVMLISTGIGAVAAVIAAVEGLPWLK